MLGEANTMTAITVTVKVSEELAHQLETIPDMEQFTKDAWAAKVKEDRAKMLEEHCMYEDDEPITEEDWKHIEEGLAQAARGEGMELEEYTALRRMERAEARAKRLEKVAV
jgi:predicted transcriptional regulator